MKKTIFKIGISVMLALVVLPALQTSAADAYQLLAPLPDLNEVPNSQEAFAKYIPYMFNLLLSLATVAAVLNIVFGGFQYMTSDAIQGKSAGKERIKNAIFAFVLILGAWLILYTINPNLLNLNLNIDPVNVANTSGGSGGNLTSSTKMTSEQIAASNTIRESLEGKGILTYRPPCANGETTGCVNLNGLQQSTITGLEKFAKDLCGTAKPCVSITGGTESGHSTTGDHPKGKAVDFAFSQSLNSKILPYLFNQISQKQATSQQTKDGELITIKETGVTFLKESDHWHVAFP